MQILGLPSQQQQVLYIEFKESETVLDVEDDVDEQHQCLFGSRISVNKFYTLVDFRLLSGNNRIVYESIVQIARFYDRVALVQSCAKQREKRGAHRHKIYVGIFSSL